MKKNFLVKMLNRESFQSNAFLSFSIKNNLNIFSFKTIFSDLKYSDPFFSTKDTVHSPNEKLLQTTNSLV